MAKFLPTAHAFAGWYVYAETSAPRRPGQAARLVSPTISPVNQSKPCTVRSRARIWEKRLVAFPVANLDRIRSSDKLTLFVPVHFFLGFQMELFIHMRGQYIGSLNIYQLPVGGFRNLKKSLVGARGSSWFREEVEFDSDKNFQVKSSRHS